MFTQQPSVVHDIPLSSLDPTDRTFALGPEWLPVAGLIHSVERAGIRSPLRIQGKSSGTYRLVSGFKRLRVAMELGLSTVPCLLVSSSDPTRLYLDSLWENLGTRDLLEVEKAWVIVRLREGFGMREDRLTREVLPALGLKGSSQVLRRYLQLYRLPASLQAQLPDLGQEVALELGKWTDCDRKIYLRIMEETHPGKNKQRQILALLGEIRDILGREAPPGRLQCFWESSGAEEVCMDQSLGRPEKFRRLQSILRAKRYPVLVASEDRAKQLKKELKIPEGLQVSLPEFFEGDRVGVQFQVRNCEQLREVAERLLEMSRAEALEQLFRLL